MTNVTLEAVDDTVNENFFCLFLRLKQNSSGLNTKVQLNINLKSFSVPSGVCLF